MHKNYSLSAARLRKTIIPFFNGYAPQSNVLISMLDEENKRMNPIHTILY